MFSPVGIGRPSDCRFRNPARKPEPGVAPSGKTGRRATAMERASRYRDTGVIPAGRFRDVRYVDLLRDPIGTVRRVYADWQVPLTDAAAQRIRQFVETTATDGQHQCGDSAAEFGLE